LLKPHIAKENNILFPMGNKILTEEDQKTLEASFKKVEEQDVGGGVHEKYHQLAHKIGI
jgi:hemerythrin-like domain-containing protein